MSETKPTILIVDDELSIRESFSLILNKEFKLLLAASGEAALKKTIDEKVDLVFLDIRMPGITGMETLKQLREIDKTINVIMVTAVNDVQNASEAIKLGAKDYLVKPFDLEKVIKIAKTFAQRKATYEEVRTVRSKFKDPKIPELIGQSKPIMEIEKIISKISKMGAAILLYGKNGTEKELVARIIHSQSEMASGPLVTYYVPIKYSEEQIQKELFGWEKGSFVAEFQKDEGVFEKALSGTLLLNNVGSLNKNLQLELLNVLSSRKFSRVGSMSTVPFNVRLICTSSIDIRELVSKGSFSKELFDQISELYLELPDLKNRPGDIPEFIRYFVDKYSMIFNKEIKLSNETMDILAGYYWPGNVTELENTIKLLISEATNNGEIFPESLPIDILLNSSADTSKYTNFDKIRTSFEKEYIVRTLKKTNQNKIKAAGILGINPKILDSKLESLNII